VGANIQTNYKNERII